MIVFEIWAGEALADLLALAARHDLPAVEVEAIAAQAQRIAREGSACEGSACDHTVKPVHVGAAWEAYASERYRQTCREGGA